MLESVKSVVSEYFTFVCTAKEIPSLPFCGDHILELAEGVHSKEIHLVRSRFVLQFNPWLKNSSPIFVFYLDDGRVGGSANDIVDDLQLVDEEACHLGLQLNHEQTELI